MYVYAFGFHFQLGCLRRRRRRGQAKTVTFCHISAITEHKYLKFYTYFQYKMGNMYIQGRSL